MKKNQVNLILVNQTKRRNTVLAFISTIIIVFFLAFSFLMMYFQKNKAQYVSYDEASSIDYKVSYTDNEFFEDNSISSNREYISSLIDKINTSFNYKISLNEKEVKFKYSYRIEANILVKDKTTGKVLYDKIETLINEIEKISINKEVLINENLDINYRKYNDLIKKFVNIYDLKNADSKLNINMYVSVLGICEDFKENESKEKLITLSIPLTENTMTIDFVDNVINSENNIMLCDEHSVNNIIILILGITLLLIDIVLIGLVIRYEIKTRTAETIYEKELKKILNNYGSNIQVLGNEFDFKNYQVLKIEDFTDILEISDKVRQPILMKENNEKTGAYFVIPSSTKILYVYRLKVSDIKKEMKK